MALSVSPLLMLLLHVVSTNNVHGSTFDIIQSPWSTNMTLVERDNIFLSFVIRNPIAHMYLQVKRRIVTYLKNGNDDDNVQVFNYFSAPEDGTLRLNMTELVGYSSVQWPTTNANDVQYKEFIMRVAHGSHLADVVRLNIQFEIADVNAVFHSTTITFNVIIVPSTAVESLEVTASSVLVQPTATSDPMLAMSDSMISPTLIQIPDCCLDCDSSLQPADYEITSTTAPVDSTPQPVLPNPTPLPASPNPLPSDSTPSSTSLNFIKTASVSPVTAAGLPVLGIVIIILIAIILILASLLYIECQKKNRALSPPSEQLQCDGPKTENSESNNFSSETMNIVITNNHCDSSNKNTI